MSRLGKLPISIPKGIEITVKNKILNVKGPKGNLSLELKDGVNIDIKDSEAVVSLIEKAQISSAFHGLYRSLLSNMITGVGKGFTKTLALIGVGYRAAVKGNKLDLQVGYSHPTEIEIPKDLHVKVDKSVEIEISGVDFQKVGQFAAQVRAIRPPEPYKGKGIRYKDEYVRKKAGKAAKTGK
ncbi:MAG: 50S ribosomal protein L6 [Parachlamydiales bacterium]|nr:50S ribosomal protein L6 [Parachlamydiales bacterium]